MLCAYDVAAVRAAEERAQAGLPAAELMRRAARGLAEVVALRLDDPATGSGIGSDARGKRVVVLAGPGDNGADALFAAADLLRDRPGASIQAVGVADALHEQALAAAQEAGVPVHLLGPKASVSTAARKAILGAQVVVDGLLGIGGRPGLRGAMAAVVDLLPASAYTIAVDLPSGVDPAGLARAERHVQAHETVTFGALKPVHLLPATEGAVGRLTLVDLPLQMEGVAAVQRLEVNDVPSLWPVPRRTDDKYSRGVVGVVAGGERYPGAAVLATTAAAGAGAGMVRYIGTPTPSTLVLQAVPEAVPRGGRVQAWVVGPGLDVADGSVAGRAQTRAARRALETPVPVVVDAGGLELLPDLLADAPRLAPTLLTPHAGELARLLSALEGDGRRAPAGRRESSTTPSISREDVLEDPVWHARRAAQLTRATVLLKGATTVVADPDDALVLRTQADASPWLATAGSGDVLAGVCGVLVAAGLTPRDAGSLAALVHGRASHLANPGGPVRALAVARALPATIAGLLS